MTPSGLRARGEWSDLPGLPLETIARHLLPSFRDFFAFSYVCRSWHYHLRSFLPCLPPLLLTFSSADTSSSDGDDPSDDDVDPPNPTYPEEEEWDEDEDEAWEEAWEEEDDDDDNAPPPSSLPPVPLRFLSPANPGRTFCPTPGIPPFPHFTPQPYGPSSTAPGSRRFLSFSHGYLLYISCRPPLQPTLINAFTTSCTLLLTLHPRYNCFHSYYAILTAPPSDPSSRFLLFFSDFAFASCPLSPSPSGGELTWTLHRFSSDISYITHVVSFQNHLFGINDSARLLVLDISPDQVNSAVHFIDELMPPRASLKFDRWSFGPQLVCSPDQLFLVLFLHHHQQKSNSSNTRNGSSESSNLWNILFHTAPPPIREIEIYRLDMTRMEWVEVKTLKDSAIFIDCVGKTPVFCYIPERWGGQSNTLYIAGPGHHKWMRCPLHKKMISRIRTAIVCKMDHHTWPSPIWIHPRFLYR